MSGKNDSRHSSIQQTKEISPYGLKINILARKSAQEEISQAALSLGIERDGEFNGIGMGVLSDGTPYLNQRGLAALCGVQNAHIGTISSQWAEASPKPRVSAIKAILSKVGLTAAAPHIEISHQGRTHFCYPAEICLAVLEYYAFDAGANCQPEARDNFRLLAGTKLREMIYAQVGYDPTGEHRFKKWHERLALNHQSAPIGYFSVFNEASPLIYQMIVGGVELSEKTVVDISIGVHWAKHWVDAGLAVQFGERRKFPHRYPQSHPQAKSNPQIAWCYPIDVLGYYRTWLAETYIGSGKFKAYIGEKARKGEIAPSVAQLAIAAVAVPSFPNSNSALA